MMACFAAARVGKEVLMVIIVAIKVNRLQLNISKVMRAS